MRLVSQSPDLSRCWIRYSLRPWPSADSLWVDLFRRGLGRSGEAPESELWESIREPLDDLLYLPPVAAELTAARRQLAKSTLDSGTPLLIQYLPGEEPLNGGELAVFDLLECLLARDLERLSALPSAAVAIWPLVSGYTDDPTLWEQGIKALAASEVRCVQGLAAEWTPTDRRRLVERGGEEGFEALFHGSLPSERRFAQTVAKFGLEPFVERPLPGTPKSLARNRWLAGNLSMVGELWLRLERGEAKGQAFYRAARWIDRETHDLTALAREGNLGVVSWLDADSSEVVEELVTEGRTSLLEELRRAYLELSS